mmetsp:Transcript_29486/g.77577  ORF Transcript_29486/g.77577 Transcript_29486/m.77577 type:complete len:204 (-) Transcript_29486:88-699(-)
MCVVLGGVSAGLLILTAPRPGSSNHRDGGDDVNSINEYTYGRFRKRGRESLNSLKRSQFSPTLSQKDEHESGAQARTRPCDYLVETFARHAISVNCHQGMNKREQAVQDATEGCSGGINKEEQPKKEGRGGGGDCNHLNALLLSVLLSVARPWRFPCACAHVCQRVCQRAALGGGWLALRGSASPGPSTEHRATLTSGCLRGG